MRVEDWNPNKMDETFETVAMDRLVEAAEVVANLARSKVPVGKVSRPMYKTGVYAGQPWTARDGGSLKRSIRVTRKFTPSGRLTKKRNIRVYAGNYFAYYARIVEHNRPFLRTAFAQAKPQIKALVGAK